MRVRRSEGARWRAALLVALAAAATAACGGATSGCGGWTDDAIQQASERDEAARRARREKIQARIDEHAKEIARDPFDISGNKLEVAKIAEEAANAGLFAAFEERLSKLKEEAERAFEDAAAAKADELAKRARSLAAEGKFNEARRAIADWKRKLGTTPAWPRCEEALAEVAGRERAEELWARNAAKADTFRQQGEPEKARGVLEAFLVLAEAIPAFQQSPRANEAQAAVASLAPEVEKARAARASEAAIKWQPAFTGRKDDLYKWEYDQPKAVEIDSEKICVFKYVDGEEPTSYMTFRPEGSDEWEDYVVTAKAWIAGNDKKVYFIAHGELVEEDGVPERRWDDIAAINPWDRTIPRNKWVDLRFEVRGGKITLYCDGATTATAGKPAKRRKGPFQIRIEKGAEIRLKEVWVKVYKPAT